MKRVIALLTCTVLVVTLCVVVSPHASAATVHKDGNNIFYLPDLPMQDPNYPVVWLLLYRNKTGSRFYRLYYMKSPDCVGLQTNAQGLWWFTVVPNSNVIRYNYPIAADGTRPANWELLSGASSAVCIGANVDFDPPYDYMIERVLYVNTLVVASNGSRVEEHSPAFDNCRTLELNFDDTMSIECGYSAPNLEIGTYVDFWARAKPPLLIQKIDTLLEIEGQEPQNFTTTGTETAGSFLMDIPGVWKFTFTATDGTRTISDSIQFLVGAGEEPPPPTPPIPPTKDPTLDWLQNGDDPDPGYGSGLDGANGSMSGVGDGEGAMFDATGDALKNVDFNLNLSAFASGFSFVGGIFNRIVDKLGIWLMVLVLTLLLGLARMIIGMGTRSRHTPKADRGRADSDTDEG